MPEKQWIEDENGFNLDGARAETFDEPKVFVIRRFRENEDVDGAIECIVAAMPHGQIAIEDSEQTRAIGKELQATGKVMFAPFVGLPFKAMGVVGVRPN